MRSARWPPVPYQMRNVRRVPRPRCCGCCRRRLRLSEHVAVEHRASLVFDMTVHGCGHGADGLGDRVRIGDLPAGGGSPKPHVGLPCLHGVARFASLLLKGIMIHPIPVYASGEPCSLSSRAVPHPTWRDGVAYACVLGVRRSADFEHRKHASQGESFVGESFSCQRRNIMYVSTVRHARVA